MLPLALFNLAWEEGDLMPYVLQVIGFERFFEVISVAFPALLWLGSVFNLTGSDVGSWVWQSQVLFDF